MSGSAASRSFAETTSPFTLPLVICSVIAPAASHT